MNIRLLLCGLCLVMALLLMPAAGKAQGNVNQFVTFDGQPLDTPAEFIVNPDLAFSATVGQAWRVDNRVDLVTLRQQSLRGPATAQLIVDVTTVKATAFSFRYASATNTPIRVEVLDGGTIILQQQLWGDDLGAGYFEGTASFGGLSFDRLVLTPAADTLIDDLNIVDSGFIEDGRINTLRRYPWQTGAVYCREGGIEVLNSIDGGPDEGETVLDVSDERVAAVGVPASANALLQRSDDRAYALYRLADGDFLLVGPGLEAGKAYTFQWDGCASRLAEAPTD